MKMVAMMVMIGLGFDANDKNFFELVEMARDVVLGGFLLVTHQSRGSLALQPALGSSEYKCGTPFLAMAAVDWGLEACPSPCARSGTRLD